MSSNPNPTVNTDVFGLWMMKPTKSGGAVWYMYNTDFNDDPQVFSESVTNEYLLHNVVDADGTQFTISASDTFKSYISSITGYNPSDNITDQQEMSRRGYMQDPQDWRNVEVTCQMVVFKEADDFITFGFRTGKHTGNGAPVGCTASSYLVEINMKAGGLIRVRKKSWNTSIHNWLSGLASGFDATKVCGWTVKILCYNTQDAKNVNIEVWLAPDNDNRFTKVLSGVDTGQINTDATVCNCTTPGQPFTWGGPFILLQGNTGTFGFKNLSIREIEGYGATLPPVDPGTGGSNPGGGGSGGGTGTGGGGSTGGGGTGSGTGGGGTGGGGGVPVDLTPVLATPHTTYTEYGGGPQVSPLEFHFIFAGADWNKAPSTTPGTTTTSTVDPILSTPLATDFTWHQGIVFDSATVHFIFWGSQWNTKTVPWSKTTIMNAIQAVFQSSYFEGLLQYGYLDGSQTGPKLCRKPKIGSIAINTTYAPVDNFDNVDIRNVIVDSINRNLVPDKGLNNELNNNQGLVPNHHIYYVIGSHNKFPDPSFAASSSFHYVAGVQGDEESFVYGYTNDMDYVNGNSTPLIYMTYGITHEIVEAITDPIFGGWFQGSTPIPSETDLGEIADSCSNDPIISGVHVAAYFSNQDNACIAPATKPSWITCPSGYTYDSVTQTCKKTTTTPGTTDTAGTANTTLKTQVQNAITSIFSSNYFTGLFQYGLTKKPTIGSFSVNATAPELGNKYTQTNIKNIVSDSIAKNQVPAASASKKNIAYFIITKPQIYYGPNQSTSNNFASAGDPPSNTWYNIYGSATQKSNFDDFTQAISYTALSMVAEQIPTKGYHMKTTTGNSTIDDKINSFGPALPAVCFGDNTNNKLSAGSNIAVAKYWSDQDGSCIIPSSSSNPTPWASCHTGAIFDNPTQSCKLQSNPGGGGTTPPGTGGGQGYKVALANASDDDGNVPANAIDGKLDTRWSAFGKGQFLRLDLGTPKKVNKIKIAWYQGDKRSNKFDITTAANTGDPFINRFSGNSKQGSTALQDYPIPETTCRYIRIVGQGNTQNDWISISEAEVWGPDVPSTTPGTGSGGDPGSGGTTPGGDTGGGTQTPPPADVPVPEFETAYNFFDTSFSCDYHKIGLCNPVE